MGADAAPRPPTVRVVVDSSSGITDDLARRAGVSVVPLTVTLGDASFPDLVGMAPSAFYEALRQSGARVLTAAPPPAAWAEVYHHAFEDGFTDVVVLGVSASISGVVGHATTAANQCEGGRVTVIDTGQAGGAQALVALAAAEAARGGADREDVLTAATRAASTVHLWMALPSLASLSRSGRLSPDGPGPPGDGVSVITVHEGTIRPVVRRPPTATEVDDALLELAATLDGVTHLMVSHTDNEDQAAALASRLRTCWPRAVVNVTPLSAVVGGHCGPGSLAVAARVTR